MAKIFRKSVIRRMRVALLSVCAWFWAMGTGWATAFLYVAPDGNDAHPGTMERPFATLHKARDAVRALKREGLPEGGATVWLRGGWYFLESTLVLTPEDSGEKGKPIVYAAYPGERPVLSGGRIITGWRRFKGERRDVTEASQGNLWVADVPKGWRFHSLCCDGMRLTRAQRPNSENAFDKSLPNIVKWGPVDPKGQVLTFPDGALDNVPGNGDVEVWLPINNWCFQLAVLRDANPTSNTARRCSKMPAYHTPRQGGYGYFGFPFRIENTLVCLDRAGEWCVDSAEGKVYFWPPGGTMEGAETIASNLVNLVRLEGRDDGEKAWVRYVEFRGLAFRHGDRLPEDEWPSDWVMRNFENPDAAIFMRGVEHCAVENCAITDVGAYAVALDRHAVANRIIGNELGWLGSGGIQLYGYGPGTRDENRENVVERNYIHHTGRAGYLHAGAVILFNSG